MSKTIEVHPLAEIFPPMSETEYLQLRESVQKNGLLDSIVLYEDRILDGRHRYRACQETGTKIATVKLNGEDPLQFVIAKNVRRRHLTESQRGMAAARLAILKHGQNKDASQQASLSQTEAAHALSIGRPIVQQARKVLDEGCAALVRAVDAGEIAVKPAASIATLPTKDQMEVVATKEPAERRKRIREAKDRAKELKERQRQDVALLNLKPSHSGKREFYSTADWQKLSKEERAAIVADGFESSTKMNPQETTRIEWAQHSLNTVTGCLHDCPYCYARDIAKRWFSYGFDPVFHPDRLAAPANTAIPPESRRDVAFRNIFANSMSDLFGQWVPAEWIEANIEMARRNPRWNFLTLTKFPSRGADFDVPDNWWLGATVDAQCRVASTEKAFARIKAKTRWLSIEPMLGPLKFEQLNLFSWIVIGGASASSKTPEWIPPFDWIADLHVQARRAGCRIYHKTNLGLHDGARLREFPWAEPRKTELPKVFQYVKGL